MAEHFSPELAAHVQRVREKCAAVNAAHEPMLFVAITESQARAIVARDPDALKLVFEAAQEMVERFNRLNEG